MMMHMSLAVLNGAGRVRGTVSSLAGISKRHIVVGAYHDDVSAYEPDRVKGRRTGPC